MYLYLCRSIFLNFYISISINLYLLSISISVSIHIYVYIYTYMYSYIYVYATIAVNRTHTSIHVVTDNHDQSWTAVCLATKSFAITQTLSKKLCAHQRNISSRTIRAQFNQTNCEFTIAKNARYG